MPYYSWNSVRKFNDYPDYEKEVVLTIEAREDRTEKAVTFGCRTKTDKEGHHWDYHIPDEFPSKEQKDIDVVAWSEKPDPYDRS